MIALPHTHSVIPGLTRDPAFLPGRKPAGPRIKSGVTSIPSNETISC